jgi:hypothetical protein
MRIRSNFCPNQVLEPFCPSKISQATLFSEQILLGQKSANFLLPSTAYLSREGKLKKPVCLDQFAELDIHNYSIMY